MRPRSVAAVAVGGITDILASTLAAFPLLVYAAATSGFDRLPPAEQAGAMAALATSPAVQTGGWALGTLASVLGGYVAARIARRGEIVHGALSSFLCIALGVYVLASGDETVPAWQHVLSFVLTPLLGALGGYLRRRQTDRAGGAALVSG